MIKVGDKKFSVGAYITFLVVVLVLIVIIFSMYKYSVEGESKPPFIISKIIVTSGAKTVNITQKETAYTATVLQNNDIKIAIRKNPEFEKEAKIKKLTINNIQISKPSKGEGISIYRPSQGINLFDYQEQYVIKDQMEYIGGAETNIKAEQLQISNQGGIVELSIAQYNLGEIQYIENEQVAVDGSLLQRVGIKQEEISFKATFDMIVELESGLKFKTTITMDLPKGNIEQNGIDIYEHTDFKAVFKRI